MGPTQIDIQDVLLSVTNFCLGSCGYCNLKDLKMFSHDEETIVEDIKHLFSDPLLDNMRNIHVTGGESLLSPKTYEIFKLLHKLHPEVRCNLPISGFFPYATYRYLKKLLKLMPQLRVDLSVDGADKATHEKTRKDSWEAILKTIDLLRSIKDFKFQLSLTLTATNYLQISAVQKWAKDLGVGFYISYPRLGIRFGHKEDKELKFNQKFIDAVDKQLVEHCKIRPLNRRVWHTQKAMWEGKKVYCDCHMGKNSIDIDPFGNVYPCMVYFKSQIFGNIRELSLTEIFNQEDRVNRIFREIKNRVCQPCIMPCCIQKTNFTIDGKPVVF